MAQAQFPVGIIEKKPGTGAIASIEVVDVVLSSGSDLTTTVALTKSQTAGQCVPFISGHYSSTVSGTQPTYSDQNQLDVDIWDDAGTPKVTVTRRAASGAAEITIKVHVVQFLDGVRVQKIYTGTPTSSTLTWTETITEIDQDRTFVIYSQRDDEIGGLYPWESCLQTSWDSDTVIRFTRQTGSALDKIKATVWIVEDVSTSGKYFNVTRYTHSSAATTSNKTITAVAAMNKTMIVGDFGVQGSFAQPNHNMGDCQLTSTTNLAFYRPSTSKTNYYTIYVVEWQNGTTIQRGRKSYSHTASTDTVQTWTQSITTVDDSASIVKYNTNRYRNWTVAGAASYVEIVATCQIELDSGGAGITGTFHGTLNASPATNTICWEVVEFDVT